MSAAGDAKRLLSDPALKAAFDFVKSSALDAAMKCAPADDAGRRHYLLAAQTVDETRACLVAVIAGQEAEDAAAVAVDISSFYERRAQRAYRTLNGENVDAHVNGVVNGA